MANETTITITGNLVDQPQLKYSPAGVAVASFRIASTPRYLDKATGEWKDQDSLFLTCSAWRQLAEGIAETFEKGMRVIVTGRLRQRSYEDREGSKRTVCEVEADDCGPSLRNASARVTRASRSGSGARRQPAAVAASDGGLTDEPPF